VTPTQYIAAAPEEKQPTLKALDVLIKRAAPSFKPFVVGTLMLGYGKYHYRYESGTEGDSCRIGLSANKGGFSLYISAADSKGWLPEQSKSTLGPKVSVGKSCIRFKNLEDLDLPSLESLIKKSHGMKAPGETSEPAKKPAAKKKAHAKKKPAKRASVKKK
jgi:hypothetical protein